MRLILDASYPNRMSYLDEWRNAWLSTGGMQTKYLNIAKVLGVFEANRAIPDADQIVILHSCTADTNRWLKPVLGALQRRRGHVVMFVGNEYSSPTVSMDKRINTIADIFPEILASQLTQTAASWLYEGKAKSILSVPQGMPAPVSMQKKEFDFAYRGFKYPSFILGNQRNEVAQRINVEFQNRNLAVNYSLHERLGKSDWMHLLATARITAASQAGSSRVFRTDEVWDHLRRDSRVRLVDSDRTIVHLSRKLPHSLKSNIRKRLVGGKTVYGSLHDDSETSRLLREQVEGSMLPSTDGRTISSRHFDAIAAGCWQILEVGEYNGILKPYVDYTPIADTDDRSITSAINHAQEMTNPKHLLEIQDRLYEFNSYGSRIKSVLKHLS